MAASLAVHDAVWVAARGDVGTARRVAMRVALARPELEPAVVGLVATELATNLVEHTEGGVLQAFADAEGLELLAVDAGARVASRSGLRAGLQTIAEQSDALEVDATEAGSVLRCRFGPPARVRFGLVQAPLRTCDGSGDGLAMRCNAEGFSAVVLDVLGHGPNASRERDVILSALDATAWERDPDALVSVVEGATRGGRGCALRWVSVEGGALNTLSAGNVSGVVLRTDGHTRLLDRPGLIGRRVDIRLRTHPWDDSCRLVVHTDGLSIRQLAPRRAGAPALEAGRLFRAAARTRDDATVLVVG